MHFEQKFPPSLSKLIQTLSRLPGVGNRGAQRFAFELIGWKEDRQREFSSNISQSLSHLTSCKTCGAWIEKSAVKLQDKCTYCDDSEKKTLCILAWARQIYSIQATHALDTSYHVLGGLIDPLDGVDIESLRIKTLRDRIKRHCFDEIILAFDTTLEGDTTAAALIQDLQSNGLDILDKIRRPAFGLPVNSSLDYIDTPTLAQAFNDRSRSSF